MGNGQRIIDGLKDAVRMADCPHEEFVFVEHRRGDTGVVGVCKGCGCRFTAWPGTVHYDQILNAEKS